MCIVDVSITFGWRVCMRNRLLVTSIEPNWHSEKCVTLNWEILLLPRYIQWESFFFRIFHSTSFFWFYFLYLREHFSASSIFAALLLPTRTIFVLTAAIWSEFKKKYFLSLINLIFRLKYIFGYGHRNISFFINYFQIWTFMFSIFNWIAQISS